MLFVPFFAVLLAILFVFRSIARPYYLLFIYFATLSCFCRSLILSSDVGRRDQEPGKGLFCIIGSLAKRDREYQIRADSFYLSLP